MQNYTLEREVKQQLTGRSTLRGRRSAMDCSAIEEEEEEEIEFCFTLRPLYSWWHGSI